MTYTTSDLIVAIQTLSRVYYGEDRHLVIAKPHNLDSARKQQVRVLKDRETQDYDLLDNGEDFDDALAGLYYTLHQRVISVLGEKRAQVAELEAALAKPIPEWCVVPEEG